MDRISNCDTNKFVYLVVHIIKFLTKINIILKKTKINNFVQKNVAYKKKKKKKRKEKTHIQFQSKDSSRSKAHNKFRKVKVEDKAVGLTSTRFMCNKKNQNLKI